jgi:tetratricopeptide (TPR) repeat protein
MTFNHFVTNLGKFFAYLRIFALLLLPFVAGWDYGGAIAWSKWFLGIGTAVLLVFSWPQLVLQPRRMPLTRSLVLVFLAIWFVGLLQTFSVPGSLVAVLSPGTYVAHNNFIPKAIRDEALRSPDPILNSLADHYYPTSLAPQLTQDFLMLPLLIAAIILISARAFNTERRLLTGLAGVALSGVLIAFLGIADRIRPPEVNALLLEGYGSSFGTFINRNNAAGYLNLALAAATGLVVWRYRWQRQQRPWDDRFEVAKSELQELIVERCRRLFSYSDSFIMIFMLSSCIILTGILVSGSRGGFVGALVGSVVVGCRAFAREQSFANTMTFVLVSVAASLLLGFIGMIDQVRDRLGTLLGSEIANENRWDHWRDAIYTAWMYFPTGSGLGSYRYAYLPYQNTSAGEWYLNADNLYLEGLVEGGLWLPMLVAIGFVMVVSSIRRLSIHENSPHIAGLIAASWFAIASMGVSQAFDFGLLLPANYFTLAILLGMTVSTADRWRSHSTGSEKPHMFFSWLYSNHWSRDEVCNTAESHDFQSLTDTDQSPNSLDESVEDTASNAVIATQMELNPNRESEPARTLTASNETQSIDPSLQAADSESLIAETLSDLTQEQFLHGASSDELGGSESSRNRDYLHSGASIRAFRISKLFDQSKLGLVISILLAIATSNIHSTAVVESWTRVERNIIAGGPQQDLLIREIDPQLLRCAENRIYDTEAQLTVASLLVTADRLESVREYRKEPITIDPRQLWQITSPEARRAMYYSGNYPLDADPQFALLKGQSKDRLQLARKHALQALLSNPLDDWSRQLLLKLDFLAGDKDCSLDLVTQFGTLRKNWAPALHQAAMLAFVHPGPEAAIALWNRALTVRPGFLAGIWQSARLISSDDTFSRALPESASILLQFAQMTSDPEVRQVTLKRAEDALKLESSNPEDAGKYYFQLATLAQLSGNDHAARIHLGSAIAADPSTTEWRFQYALLLEKEGRTNEAIEQLRRCILQKPSELRYQKKEKDLRTR